MLELCVLPILKPAVPSSSVRECLPRHKSPLGASFLPDPSLRRTGRFSSPSTHSRCYFTTLYKSNDCRSLQNIVLGNPCRISIIHKPCIGSESRFTPNERPLKIKHLAKAAFRDVTPLRDPIAPPARHPGRLHNSSRCPLPVPPQIASTVPKPILRNRTQRNAPPAFSQLLPISGVNIFIAKSFPELSTIPVREVTEEPAWPSAGAMVQCR
jgi:hypothetical protein